MPSFITLTLIWDFEKPISDFQIFGYLIGYFCVRRTENFFLGRSVVMTSVWRQSKWCLDCFRFPVDRILPLKFKVVACFIVNKLHVIYISLAILYIRLTISTIYRVLLFSSPWGMRKTGANKVKLVMCKTIKVQLRPAYNIIRHNNEIVPQKRQIGSKSDQMPVRWKRQKDPSTNGCLTSTNILRLELSAMSWTEPMMGSSFGTERSAVICDA